MSDLIIHLDGVSIRTPQRTIVENIHFQIEEKEIITLIGPNGAGKTTLVKAILGLRSITEGQLTRRPQLRIGYMPQKLQVEPTLPITVKRFLSLTGAGKNDIQEALARVGIRSLLNTPMQNVSGGELQRTLLARALLRKPQFLVLDEPAQGVDLTGQTELYKLIKQLRDDLHCAVLMVSHDLHLVMSSTDKVICLNQHICCSGHPEQVSNDPAYLALFGEAAAQIALYHHHHNHSHTLHGDVVQTTPCTHEHHHA